MEHQEWLVGTRLMPSELAQRLEELQAQALRSQVRHVHLLSWFMERRLTVQEREWRQFVGDLERQGRGEAATGQGR